MVCCSRIMPSLRPLGQARWSATPRDLSALGGKRQERVGALGSARGVTAVQDKVYSSSFPTVVIGLNAVIVAVTEEVPRILTVKPTAQTVPVSDGLGVLGPDGGSADALPFGPLEPERHRTLER